MSKSYLLAAYSLGFKQLGHFIGKSLVSREFLIVVLSFLVQLPLAVFLGHYYDQRVFMATGYAAGIGLNPYQPHFITVFQNPLLTGFNPIIGYPPPWPLLLGLIYRLSFNLTQNLLLYNLALKIPIIIGNIALAYIVKNLLKKSNASAQKVQSAWLFLLFNPFTLLTTSAWGQFDTLIALLCIVSIYFLNKGKIEECAITLALAIAIKPIAFPLIGLPLLFSGIGKQKKYRYAIVFVFALLVFSALPFYLMGWSIPFNQNEFTPHLNVAGGLTPFNLVELFYGTLTLPSGLEFLGFIWIGAVILGYYAVYRDPPKSMTELFEKAIFLTMIFFLSRTWLSEPNVNLIIPLALLTLSQKEINFHNFAFLWILPLIFMLPNTSLSQLFFLISPQSAITSLLQFDASFRFWRLMAKFIIAVIWQIFAWRIVIQMLGKKRQ